MARIVIASHAPSNTVNALSVFMNNQSGDHTVLRMRRTGSRFVGRTGDILLNYGSRNSELETRHVGAATLLNAPSNVANASDKIRAFNLMSEAGVSAVESTTDINVARSWMEAGDHVFVRNTVSGHSGEGIEVYGNSQPESSEPESISVNTGTLPRAPLYTKGMFIGVQHREFRIHVMKGVVTFVQQKKRREGWREIPEYSNIVRNFHTGWVYANQSAARDVNRAALYHAVKAIEALGLDYGAVDVITRQNQAFVLEVNTAPGMTGTNLEVFAKNIIKIHDGSELTSVIDIPSTDPMLEADAAIVPDEQPAEETTLTGMDQRFVKVAYNNIVHVGFYNRESDTYTLAGVEIAIPANEVFVISVI